MKKSRFSSKGKEGKEPKTGDFDSNAIDDPQPSTSRSNEGEVDIEDQALSRLRNRKINLNRLSASITCPQVCQFQHCGIQLRDGDQLEWHYQGHIAQEMQKLKKLRIKKSQIDQNVFNESRSRRLVRNSAVEQIRFHREKRLALARSNLSTTTTTSQENPVTRPLECPVCGRSDDLEENFSNHVEGCLRTAPPPPEEREDYESDVDQEDDGLDVDSMNGFETYTWAGQTRVRATSLVEGGLRGAGFMTITRGDEDGELDIENVDDELIVGAAQYTDADVILSNSDIQTGQDHESGESSSSNLKETSDENEFNNSGSDDSDLKTLVSNLLKENEDLKKQTVCKICMDPVYNKPLVSLVCWHVHCEQCWLRALGSKKLCPQCKVIIQPKDLRRIYL